MDSASISISENVLIFTCRPSSFKADMIEGFRKASLMSLSLRIYNHTGHVEENSKATKLRRYFHVLSIKDFGEILP